MRFGIIILLLFVFIACTDYVQQIDDRYGEWDSSLSSEKVESSSSSSSDTLLSSFLESSSSIDGSEYDSTTNTLKDLRDGRTYRTVVIGSRPWMAENLNFETESSYCYGDKDSSCSKWGRLYTWAAAMDSAGIWSSDGEGCGYIKTCMPEGNVRGVCPQGWHLPNNDEWSNMLGTVGTNQGGIVLKSTSGWNNNGNGTDAFGFTALPAGNRNLAGGYNYLGVNASFWSSTEYGSDGAWYMYLVYYNAAGFLYNLDKYYALSVRCLKD